MASVHNISKYNYNVSFFFPYALQQKSGLDRLIVEVSIPYTHTHTTSRTPLKKCSARRRRRYLRSTQQTHVPSGIRTPDAGGEGASDIQPKPHGHRDRN